MKHKIMCILFSVLMFCMLCACDADTENEYNTDTENECELDSSLFEYPSTIYRNELALVAAKMSEAVEDTTDNKIKNLFNSYNIYDFQSFNYDGGWTAGGAFAIGQVSLNITGSDTTVLVIVARGSTTTGEYIGDLWKGWYLDPDKVHSVLNRTVWDNIYDFEVQLREGITEYANNHPSIKTDGNLKLLITGHSLGGAAANLLGARFTNEGMPWGNKLSKDDIYVYTFGAIKVLTTEKNASTGYENIHNIYNHFDSFGPNGNLSITNASSINAKFGHTEEYKNDHSSDADAKGNPAVNHIMSKYIGDLENGFIVSRPCTECGNTNSCLSSQDTSNLAPSEMPEQNAQVNNFSIEGTWKNTGTTAFGQAQVGSIIVFDGSHCNYYSPHDTYVLYYENDQWTLECASYIFAETLTFRVDVINENMIDIFYGSDAVRLERLSRDAELLDDPTEVTEEPSLTITNFVIEGSWQSVGSDGFGQAQPGATIAFDGTHCNFFSPYDTYAFYQDNGQWKLDCTSFLFSETLTFKVEVIDSDSINIYYGSNCTELKRTG